MEKVKNDWSREEIAKLYDMPFLDLVYKAASVHREHHEADAVQVCSLLSIKTCLLYTSDAADE